jgi:hypothetical protein
MDMNGSVKARRLALNMSQGALAKLVRQLSGSEKFTQQALAKFESKPGAQSAYLHYIIQALNQAEREAGIAPPDADAFAERVRALDDIDDLRAIALVLEGAEARKRSR